MLGEYKSENATVNVWHNYQNMHSLGKQIPQRTQTYWKLHPSKSFDKSAYIFVATNIGKQQDICLLDFRLQLIYLHVVTDTCSIEILLEEFSKKCTHAVIPSTVLLHIPNWYWNVLVENLL